MNLCDFETVNWWEERDREREETAGVAVTEERKRDAPARNILLC